MSEAPNKKSRKVVVPLALLCFALCGLLMALGGRWAVLLGPADMAGLSPNALEGRYVTAEITAVVDEYAYLEERPADGGEGQVVGREYAVYTPDGGHVMGLLLEGEALNSQGDGVAALIEDGNAAPVQVTGTVVPMDEESVAMFDELLHYHSISENMAVHSLLVAGQVGTLPANRALPLFWLGIALAVLGISLLVAARLRRR